MVFGIIPECRSASLRNWRSASPESPADNPKLPADSLAAVLVVNSYHHFEQYEAMDQQILRVLKPGGRLVIADYSLPAHRTESRADQIKAHEIDPNLVREELWLPRIDVRRSVCETDDRRHQRRSNRRRRHVADGRSATELTHPAFRAFQLFSRNSRGPNL